MPAPRIVEPVYVFEDSHLGVTSRSPGALPDQLCLDGFRERFHRRVVIAIARSTHRHLEPTAGAGFFGSRESGIGCRDPYGGCSPSMVAASQWPCGPTVPCPFAVFDRPGGNARRDNLAG